MTIWGAREQNIAIFWVFGDFLICGVERRTWNLCWLVQQQILYQLRKNEFRELQGTIWAAIFLSQPIRGQYFILPLKSVLTHEMIVLMHIWHQSEQLIKWLLKTFHQIEKFSKKFGLSPRLTPKKFFFRKKS